MEQLPSIQKHAAEIFALGQNIVSSRYAGDTADLLKDHTWRAATFNQVGLLNAGVLTSLDVLGFEHDCTIVVVAEEQAPYINQEESESAVSAGYESVIIYIDDVEIRRSYEVMLDESSGLEIVKTTLFEPSPGDDIVAPISLGHPSRYTSKLEFLMAAAELYYEEANTGLHDLDLAEAEALRDIMLALSKA